jgi:parallel beta-helix repeat protein
MPKYPYRDLGTGFDRNFRNDLNANFDDVEADIKEVENNSIARDNDLDARIDNIVADAGSSNTEIVDARYDSVNNVTYPTLKDRLDDTSDKIGILYHSVIYVESFPIQVPETDDTARIQRAISSLSGKGKLIFSSKTYTVSDRLIIPANTEVVMEKGGKIKNTTPGLFGIFTVGDDVTTTTTPWNITFKGLKIEGTGSVGTTTTPLSEVGILVQNSTDANVTVEDCEIYNLTIAIEFKNSTKCEAKNNYIHDIVGTVGASEGYGVLCSYGGEHNIHHNRFINIQRHCVYLSAGTMYNDVHDNWMINSKKNPIQIYTKADGSSSDPTQWNHVHDNHIIGVTNPSGQTGQAQGIVVLGYSCFNIIENNLIKDVADEGIKITSESPERTTNDYTNYRTAGNIIKNNTIINVYTGIYVKISDDNEIKGNTIKDCSYNGITIAAFGTGTNVYSDNNKVIGNTTQNCANKGIEIPNTGSRYTVVYDNFGINNGADFSDGGTGTKFNEFTERVYISRAFDGAELLRFNTERQWAFYQRGAGSSAKLALRDIGGDKTFVIEAADGSSAFEVIAYRDTTAPAVARVDGKFVVTVKQGSGSPTVNADFVGQIYVDTLNKIVYTAVQTGTGATDWKQISN